MRCPDCKKGNWVLQTGKYPYKESGLSNIYLKNIEWRKCSKCKATETIIPRVSQLHRCIAWRVITKPSLLSGDEIKFVRKMLRCTQKNFANALGISHVTVSRWEHGRKQSKESDLLVRLLYLSCADDEFTHELHNKLWKLLTEVLNEIEDEVSTKRVTIDPSECTPDKEIRATLALCTVIEHQRRELATG